MSSKIKVRLISGTNPFHRSVRNDAGAVVETMVFPPGMEVEVDGANIPAILDALRTADNPGGVLAEVNDKGKQADASSKAVDDAKKAVAAKAKAALAAKPPAAPPPTTMDLRTLSARMEAMEASIKQLHDVVSELEAKATDPKPAKKG